MKRKEKRQAFIKKKKICNNKSSLKDIHKNVPRP